MIRQPQTALEYYNQALKISKTVGANFVEASTLSNIALVYRNINRPDRAIDNLEKSVKITLEIRRGLKRNNQEQTRQRFLGTYDSTAIALIDLLIDQKKYDKAFEWANLVTTADLADYTQLVNAKVANPEARKALSQWNQKNAQLEGLRQQLQVKFSTQLAEHFRKLEAEINQQAEDISRQFPEIAELFETTPKDIALLRGNIPEGSVIVQPVLLTDITNVPNTIAIFVITKDKLTAIKKPIQPSNFDDKFDNKITKYRKQLENPTDPDFINKGEQLYDILIRPVEKLIKAASPKQLNIIASGKLRYIPFETLYDKNAEQYLIEKYPINYLTRLSTRSLQQQVNRKKRRLSVLALGNPSPTPLNLSGAEVEAKELTKIFRGSEAYIKEKATLETFKFQAPRFSILHLGTHGCFQVGGCFNGKMEENTLLFANNQKYNIADAALLGLKNTELITLTACQTAKEPDVNGEEISGLAYIFERAGAKSVIASLWNAEDKTSQEIIIQFYQNLKNGMSKGEALRQAKISQIKRNPDLHPFNWSPLILIGDAR